MDDVESVEDSICEAFKNFVIKLGEEQLRPIVVSNLKWALKSK